MPIRITAPSLLASVSLSLGLTLPAQAQCEPVWQPVNPGGAGILGTNGNVNVMMMWDPDDQGPQTPKLVVGGEFTIAGTVQANNIAAYDPATGQWSAFASGLTGSSLPAVFALAALPEGTLVAGGTFTTAGGVSASRIAVWNGTAWSPLGLGMSGSGFTQVNALVVLPSGELVAGGQFTSAGGVRANHIARWNGVEWSPLGSGVSSGTSGNVFVSDIEFLASGDLVAGGIFTTAGGETVNNIARWDGSAWLPLGAGVGGGTPFSYVFDLTVLANGDVIAGGAFTFAGDVSANRIARWDGAAWSPLGTGLEGNSFPWVFTVATLPNGDVLAGGEFTSAGGVSANRVARWDGTAWSPLGSGMSGGVFDLEVLGDGDVLAAGSFTFASGVTASRIARGSCITTTCDSLDFNNDTVFPDDNDLADFVRVLGGGDCPTCNDVDFNNDGVFPDDSDLAAYLRVLGGGSC